MLLEVISPSESLTAKLSSEWADELNCSKSLHPIAEEREYTTAINTTTTNNNNCRDIFSRTVFVTAASDPSSCLQKESRDMIMESTNLRLNSSKSYFSSAALMDYSKRFLSRREIHQLTETGGTPTVGHCPHISLFNGNINEYNLVSLVIMMQRIEVQWKKIHRSIN